MVKLVLDYSSPLEKYHQRLTETTPKLWQLK